MPRGGSKPGERRGGRKKGTPNRKLHPRRISAAEGIALAKAQKRTPLEVILGRMNGEPWAEALTPEQLACAIAAAPYVHPKLAAVAYTPLPDAAEARRRDLLRGLSYAQRQAILDIMATAQVQQIEGEASEAGPK